MKIQRATKTEMDTVTYNFSDGTKQSQPINKEVFLDIKGKRKNRNDVIELFQQIAWDRRAESFTIDAETSEVRAKEVEETFTPIERKNARRDYKEFRQRNPEGFAKARGKFRAEFSDKLMSVKRLRYDLREEGVQLSN